MVGRREVVGAGVLLVWPPPWTWSLLGNRGRPRPLAPVTNASVGVTLSYDVSFLVSVCRYFVSVETNCKTT
jgi:hypothetical protein